MPIYPPSATLAHKDQLHRQRGGGIRPYFRAFVRRRQVGHMVAILTRSSDRNRTFSHGLLVCEPRPLNPINEIDVDVSRCTALWLEEMTAFSEDEDYRVHVPLPVPVRASVRCQY